MSNSIYKITTICTLMATSMLAVADSQNSSISPVEEQKFKLSKILDPIKIFDPKKIIVDARADQSESVKDPLQSLNRKVYVFNDTIDKNVLRPVAVIYSEVTPPQVQGAYSNFRNNLKEPWSAVNQLLQGKPKTSLKTLGRFTINTLTSLGFADPAKHLNLVNERDTFATTLGVWGVPSGPYIVLPFFGSSSLRDAIGSVPDTYARPQSYIIDPDELVWANTALEVTALRAQYLSVDSLLQGDKYAAMRDVYLQQRAFEIAQKRGEDVSESLFSDDDFEEDDSENDSDEQNLDTETDLGP